MTIKDVRFKPFIQTLKKKVQPQNLQSLTISEDKLLNGKSGTVTLINSKENKNRTKRRRIKSKIAKRLIIKNQKAADTQLHSRDV